MAVKYDIVIATCGQAELSQKCFYSVVQNSTNYRIIWIDNCQEASRELIKALFYNVTHVRPPENIGYTKAMNTGLALSTAPFVVLLNDDTEVPADWLPKLEEPFKHTPKLAAVGPRDSKPKRTQGRIPADQGFHIVTPQKGAWGWDVQMSFFCVMLCREAIETIGYLSEEFHPGPGADDDWCMRAHLAGWKLSFQTDLTIKHVGGASHIHEKFPGLQARNVERLKKKYGGRR
jgi:GT2 family glycosyltransferase